MDILERIIQKPLDVAKSCSTEAVEAAVAGLIEIFVNRLCLHPVTNAVRAYNILIKHLELAYNNVDQLVHWGSTRKQIFQLLLKLRADAKFHLGVEKPERVIHYSPYLICRSPVKVTTLS